MVGEAVEVDPGKRSLLESEVVVGMRVEIERFEVEAVLVLSVEFELLELVELVEIGSRSLLAFLFFLSCGFLSRLEEEEIGTWTMIGSTR